MASVAAPHVWPSSWLSFWLCFRVLSAPRARAFWWRGRLSARGGAATAGGPRSPRAPVAMAFPAHPSPESLDVGRRGRSPSPCSPHSSFRPDFFLLPPPAFPGSSAAKGASARAAEARGPRALGGGSRRPGRGPGRGGGETRRRAAAAGAARGCCLRAGGRAGGPGRRRTEGRSVRRRDRRASGPGTHRDAAAAPGRWDCRGRVRPERRCPRLGVQNLSLSFWQRARCVCVSGCV